MDLDPYMDGLIMHLCTRAENVDYIIYMVVFSVYVDLYQYFRDIGLCVWNRNVLSSFFGGIQHYSKSFEHVIYPPPHHFRIRVNRVFV
jgi:hypothetical protein